MLSEMKLGSMVTKAGIEAKPAAKSTGDTLGKEITRGLTDNLDIGTAVAKATIKARSAATVAGAELGKIYGSAFNKAFALTLKDPKNIKVNIDDKSLASIRGKINFVLRDAFTIKIKADIDRTSLLRAAAAFKLITAAQTGGGGGKNTIDDLIRLLTPGGGGRGRGGAAGGGFIGGINALIRSLPGGTAGSVGAVPPAVGVPAGIIGALALPFIAQQISGFLVGGLGTGLAGIGIAGALMGNVGKSAQVSSQQMSAAHDRVIASQLRLQAAQQRLSALQQSGNATAAQLSSAQASVAGAMGSVASAQDRYNKLQDQSKQAQQTKRVQDMQKAWQGLQDTFKTFMQQVGQAFVPVLTNIFNTAGKVLKVMAPVFSDAMKIIAGPFQVFVDAILNAFKDPQVQSSITAVATAFADILKAFTPDIKGIMDSFADAIKRMAEAVAKNPKAFADFLNFLFQVVILFINGLAALTNFVDYIELHFMPAMHDIAHIFDLVRHWVAAQWDQMWQDTIGRAIRAQRHLEQLISGWLHNIAHWFDVGRHWIATQWDQMWQDTVGRTIRFQRHLQQLISGWLHNMAHWFDVARHDVASAWDTMWNNTIDRAVRGWQWLYQHVWTPVRDFFTKTLPGWIQTATDKVGQFWDKIRDKIAKPVRWVGKSILSKLFNFVDDITNFVGLGKPLNTAANALANLSSGGYIASGRGPRVDDQLALLARGELVVPAHLVGSGAVDHLRGRIPGFAGGGTPNPLDYATTPYKNPIGKGAKSARIDMGVDYTGAFDIYALGDGIIVNVYNSGWPGGTFISEILANGPNKGSYWYAAEHIIPYVKVGQVVRAGQKIGHAPDGYPFTEFGWAASPGTGQTMANISGQANKGKSEGDPGRYSTAFGVQASNLIVSLGGPPGILTPGGIQGGGKGLFNIIKRTLASIFGGLGNLSKVAIAMATGNEVAAKNALAKLIPHGAGGAGGALAKMLIALPAKLITSAVHFLISKVKGFADQQQAASAVPYGIGPTSADAKQAQAYAKSRLSAFGWGQNQMNALIALWTGESNWNRLARNASSGAYGIPQALPASKMGRAANPPTSSASAQIDWGLNYILSTYGSPAAAFAKWSSRSPHWYAQGTESAMSGWGWVGEHGPELIRFLGGEKVIPTHRLFGYAAGTSVTTLEAEIRRLEAQIRVYRSREPLVGPISRQLLEADITVARAHIADLQRRIWDMTHQTSTVVTAAAKKMSNAGASLAANLAKITTATTPASFAATQRLFLKDLRLYFSPSVANARSRLVIGQIKQMQSLEDQVKTLSTNIANATEFQKQELAHLQAGTGLGNIGIQGHGAAQARGLLGGLNRQIAVINSFGNAIRNLSRAGASQALLRQVAGMEPSVGAVYGNKMVTLLRKLKGLHVPTAMLNQIIALGPDAGLAYADALLHADKRTLAQIIAAENRLAAAQLGVSRGVTSVVSGGAYVTGANFMAGLKAQQKNLEKMFGHLGRVLAQEAIYWFRVAPKQRPYGYQHGGWINEPVSGFGLYSGATYAFAEKGREYVLSQEALARWHPRGGDGGSTYVAHFDGLTGEAIESHVRTAFHAMSLTQGSLQRQGRRT